MIVDNTTLYSILHNWQDPNQTYFVLGATNQEGSPIGGEIHLPTRFILGSTFYTYDTIGPEFFNLTVDTFSLYVSEVTFDVTESNLDPQSGIYSPVKATFHGVGHSFPWISGQPPIDTIQFSGSFCLNGYIL